MQWHKGVIVLEDKTVVTGDVCYKYEFALVFVKEGTKVISFSAKNVSSVRFYDEIINVNRYFIRIEKVNSGNNLKVYNTLFEVVTDGDIQVLRTPKKYMGVSNSKEDILQCQRNYEYYLKAFGALSKLSDFKDVLLPKLYQTMGSPIKNIISKNKLNLSNAGDCIRLIVFYNQASAGSGVVLSSL